MPLCPREIAALSKCAGKAETRIGIEPALLGHLDEERGGLGAALARHKSVGKVDELLRGLEDLDDSNTVVTGDDCDVGAVRAECRTTGRMSMVTRQDV